MIGQGRGMEAGAGYCVFHRTLELNVVISEREVKQEVGCCFQAALFYNRSGLVVVAVVSTPG